MTNSREMSAEQVIVKAAFHPSTWTRRMLVEREVRYMARLLRCDMPTALIPWATAALRIRAPTTVLNYWHTAVATVLGATRNMSAEHRMWYRGVTALYGTTHWYGRTAEMTMTEARSVVDNRAAPLWIRVWLDVAWHAVGRAADLQYLTAEDVVCEADVVTVYFMFLKNAVDGPLGAVKRLKLWNPVAFRNYLDTMQASPQLFPWPTRAINAELEKHLSDRRTTRDVRRGGARLLTISGAEPEQIARLMAHRSTETQRGYTQMGNAAVMQRDAAMQDMLSAPTRRPVMTSEESEVAASVAHTVQFGGALTVVRTSTSTSATSRMWDTATLVESDPLQQWAQAAASVQELDDEMMSCGR